MAASAAQPAQIFLRVAEAVETLDRHYSELKATARQRLGSLFNAGDYPASLGGAFSIDADFPSVDLLPEKPWRRCTLASSACPWPTKHLSGHLHEKNAAQNALNDIGSIPTTPPIRPRVRSGGQEGQNCAPRVWASPAAKGAVGMTTAESCDRSRVENTFLFLEMGMIYARGWKMPHDESGSALLLSPQSSMSEGNETRTRIPALGFVAATRTSEIYRPLKTWAIGSSLLIPLKHARIIW